MKHYKKVVSLFMLVSSKGLMHQKLLMEGINVKHPNFKKQKKDDGFIHHLSLYIHYNW